MEPRVEPLLEPKVVQKAQPAVELEAELRAVEPREGSGSTAAEPGEVI